MPSESHRASRRAIKLEDGRVCVVEVDDLARVSATVDGGPLRGLNLMDADLVAAAMRDVAERSAARLAEERTQERVQDQSRAILRSAVSELEDRERIGCLRKINDVQANDLTRSVFSRSPLGQGRKARRR